MKTTLAFTISCLLSISLLGQQPQPPRDTIIVPVVPTTDSVVVKTQEFEIRRPLTQQEEQRRADNRAEVENMKSRFRQFHQEEQREKDAEAIRAEDANYIWSDAEQGGQVQRKGTTDETAAPSTNTENLRMEIGRNLQEGRKMNTPDRPVLPEYPSDPLPASYDYPSSPRPATEDWQSDIRSSLQTGSSDQNEQWQARVGTGTVGLVDPHSGIPLRAGQTIILHKVSFAEGSATLTPVTKDALHQWAKVLRQYPGLIVQVRAHVNSKVPAYEAQQLTNQRAAAIVLFWQEQGITQQQLSSQGYGQLSPLVSSADPLALQKNERIEVVILELPER